MEAPNSHEDRAWELVLRAIRSVEEESRAGDKLLRADVMELRGWLKAVIIAAITVALGVIGTVIGTMIIRGL